MSGPALATCRQEIERLHEFFVAWYTGRLDTEEFVRMDDAIGPDFEMVSPEGDRLNRDEVLSMVEETHGEYASGSFDIEIRNVEAIDISDDYAVIRYEERQTTPDGTNSRLSTVLFHTAPENPGGLSWVTVHETWLERKDRTSV